MRRLVRLATTLVVVSHALFAPIAAASEEIPLPVETSPGDAIITEVPVASPPIETSPREEPAQVVEAALTPIVAAVEPVDPPLVLPPLLINRVVAGMTGHASYEYVELYNPNPHDVVIDSWRVILLRKEGSATKQEFIIHGMIKANGYMLIGGSDTALDSLIPEFRLNSSFSMVYTGGVVQLANASNIVVEQLHWGDGVPLAASYNLAADDMLERNYIAAVPRITGDPLKDFSRKVAGTTVPKTGGYIPYVAPVNRCLGVIISEIAANVVTDQQFIELHNPTQVPIKLDDCLLQTNRSTAKNFVLTGTLGAGEYKAIYIAAAGLTLTKTTTGTVYMLSSDGKEEVAASSYDGLAEGTSWSWFGGGDWRQTFAVSPGTGSVWQEFLPCEAGYERNSETGRCRKVVVPEPQVTCDSGKYLSLETGRCRNVETADVMTACQSGQYRNPETNRCRSVATAASTLLSCREGQERNPDTNRCRNVVSSVPQSAFAVEPIKDTGKAFVGWWAVGGIGALALGRGVWEWRSEMLAGIRKVGAFFISSK